ncbi:hypothetical protein HMPREF9442_00205 [Paraprevotella xylaniphila YIT 11841]|uniref:Uncharacterized protein n=1 Tax=Paraprevotella xylaniphila YIT 11841 TaxID=762982 RepID=F3QPW7_9BACT|nr:hypothetical protein HMPREF9442_00205 [Paraprevotella xylaniphila YIT 11841]
MLYNFVAKIVKGRRRNKRKHRFLLVPVHPYSFFVLIWTVESVPA